MKSTVNLRPKRPSGRRAWVIFLTFWAVSLSFTSWNTRQSWCQIDELAARSAHRTALLQTEITDLSKRLERQRRILARYRIVEARLRVPWSELLTVTAMALTEQTALHYLGAQGATVELVIAAAGEAGPTAVADRLSRAPLWTFGPPHREGLATRDDLWAFEGQETKP